MKPSFTPNKKTRMIYTGLAVIFWLLVWQGVYLAVDKPYLLESPVRVFARLIELAAEPLFRRSVLATCGRVLAGFFTGVLVGIPLAFLAYYSGAVKALLSPLMRAVRATPVASFIILALVWLSTARLPAFIAFLMVLPLAYSNLTEGIGAIDSGLLEMARIFKFSRARTIRLIYLPGLMPYITAICTAGLGFSWKSVIAAEVLSHPALSIGKQIRNAWIYLEIPDLLAWTMAVILISIAIEWGTVAILRRINRWLLRGIRV